MSQRRYIDRDGRLVDANVALDERGVLKDGFGVHTPLFLMDATQREIAHDAKRKKVTQYDPYGRVKSTYEEETEADSMMTDAQLALHRPGYRTSTTADDSEAVKAYREYVDAQCNAWMKRDAQPPGSYPLSAGEGSACTVDGRPGTLVREGDWLVCRPTPRTDAAPTGPVFDAAEGQRIKDAAWEEMCQRQRDAWKTKP
jgi:hypothetical protein